jgi:hypothetical protein
MKIMIESSMIPKLRSFVAVKEVKKKSHQKFSCALNEDINMKEK